MPWDKGIPWRSYDTFMANSFKSQTKTGNMRLHCWIHSGTLYPILADFDCLPEQFNSFDQFADYLSKIYKEKGITFRSHSKKVKVLFIAEVPKGLKMSYQIALDTLESIFFADDLFKYIDKSVSALSVTFLNPVIINTISKNLSTTKPVKATIDNIDLEKVLQDESLNPDSDILDFESLAIRDTNSSSISCIPTSKYRYKVEELDPKLQLSENKIVKEILKILSATPQLIKQFDISQYILANTLGVSQKTISKALAKIQKLGLLEVSNSHFVPGKKAKSYQAKGALLLVLKDKFGTKNNKFKKPLPAAIKDGEWNDILSKIAVSNFRKDPEGFSSWANSLPDSNKKDRKLKIKKLTKWLKNISIKKQHTRNQFSSNLERFDY